MASSKLLQYSEEDRVQILKEFDRTPETVRQDIEAIKTWLRKQPHLPESTDDGRIERFLLLNKFSIERTKERIDMYYTIRQLIPEFHSDLPDTERMQKICQVVYHIALPKLTKDRCRVIVHKLRETNPDDMDIIGYFIHYAQIREILLCEDYSASFIGIIDIKGATIQHFLKLTPSLLKKQVIVFEKVFASRMQRVCFINFSPVGDACLKLLKSLLSEKLKNRILVSRDESCIYECIPKDVLPKDYGGDEESIEALNEKWKMKLLEYKPRYQTLQQLKVNQKLRPGPPIDYDLLGIQGNFRTLNVD